MILECKPDKPFPPQIALGQGVYLSKRKQISTEIDTDVSIVIMDVTVLFLGSIIQGLWNFRLEKPLNSYSGLGYSVRAWKIRALRAMQMAKGWLVKVQR